MLRHWKLILIAVCSFVLVVFFQNCADDFNAGDYSLSSTDPTTPSATDTAAPSILTPLQSTTIQQGETAAFSITAKGSNLTFSWKKDGTPLEAGNKNFILIENAQPTQAGEYEVTVRNSLGELSSKATLTVQSTPVTPPPPSQAPVIVTPPYSDTVLIIIGLPNPSHTFFVSATGANLSYQWYFKSETEPEQLLAGKTQNYLTLTNVNLLNAGQYRVEVSNPAGKVSATATLSIEIDFGGGGGGIIPKPTGLNSEQ